MLTRHLPPPGFTLIELLLGLVATSVLAAAVLGVTIRQQRFARAIGAIVGARRAVREGADMLRYDLRAAAPAAGGVYAMGPNFIELRLPIGVSVACAIDSSRTTLIVPPHGKDEAALTAWIVEPEAGDTVLVLNATASDDSVRWRPSVLARAPSAGGNCPSAGGLAGIEDSAASPPPIPSPLAIQVTAPLGIGIGPGAALRFVRRARYQLYRAGDGDWYLGFLDCVASRATPCAGLQPVSGPYTTSGATFQYFDSAGTPTADRLRVARIEIALGASSQRPLRVEGLPRGLYSDSIAITIAPRN